MTISSTAKRLERLSQSLRHGARPQGAPLQPFQRSAAFREPLLSSLQRSVESLEADARGVHVQRCSGGCASSLSRTPQSIWRRTPTSPACRDAPGGGLQLPQSTAMPREVSLQSHCGHPLGRKNRLQQRRGHLPELEAQLQVVRTCEAAKRILCAVQGFPSAATKHHETTFLGLQ